MSDDLLAYLDSSRSPWHAVASAAARLDSSGFVRLELTDDEQHLAGYLNKHYYKFK